tara:strand:- start:11869 stop:12276 length:408 start_codon:yes stop_codon:yes gene_type:complete
MKLIVFLLFIVSLAGCKKENQTFIPTPEYLSIVGDWKNIDGDINTVVSIKSIGAINTISSYQRERKILVDKISYTPNYNINGVSWNVMGVTENYKNGAWVSMLININNNSDTLMIIDTQRGDNAGYDIEVRYVKI